MTMVPASLVDILLWRAAHQPDCLAYRFLADAEQTEITWTYKDLDQRSRAIAALLQANAKEGDRILLFFSPGLDFVAAFFGCLYAKTIAVPVYPPHPARLEKTLVPAYRIISDARPAVALMPAALFDAIKAEKSTAAAFAGMVLLATDDPSIDGNEKPYQLPQFNQNDLAFLQYTSGSTTVPKGVMVSHSNLLHNLDAIKQSFGHSEKSHAVIWLPPYHDMGLIGGILQPLYAGFAATLFPHLLFLQRPLRWLQAITKYRATTSGAPNFAYDLCVQKIKPEQRDLLDLHTWDVAFNGAEPVLEKTLAQFATYFAPCGFRQEAFLPCYGLAEATLLVTGGPKCRPIVKQHLSGSALARNKVHLSTENSPDIRTVVSCGRNLSNQEIRIVNPETAEPCAVDEIGEVWIRGTSVAAGYWQNIAATTSSFGAWLGNGKEGPFLRTGDLGFLKDGELYITGRLKNLLICEGKNHYPHDLERTVEESHPAILPTGSAVFALNENPERIVVVAEIKHRPDVKTDEVVKAIRSAISVGHGIHVDDVRLTNPGGIPKTTSGKKKHFLCREHYLTGTLKEIL